MVEDSASDRNAPQRERRGPVASPRGPRTRRVSLRVDVDAAAKARSVVDEVAADLDRRDDILLATSELVTNVVRHAPRLRAADLVARRDGCTVRVSVHQAKGSFTSLTPLGSRVGGYGLGIVDAVSDRWGVEENDTVSVWFEISD